MKTNLTKRHLRNADILTDIAVSTGDGLVIPFALAAGLSIIVSSTQTILIICFTVLAAGSIIMSIGGFLTAKTEAARHHNNLSIIKNGINSAILLPQNERDKTRQFLAKLDLGEEIQQQAVDEMIKEKRLLIEYLVHNHPEDIYPNSNRAQKSAFNIGLFYFAGGIVPLLPYFFIYDPVFALKVSAVATLSCLFLFGLFKGKFTGTNPWISAFRSTIIGTLAVACAVGVASIIRE